MPAFWFLEGNVQVVQAGAGKMKKMNANALLAGVRSNTLIAGLFILLIVSMVLLFVNFAYINTQADYDNE